MIGKHWRELCIADVRKEPVFWIKADQVPWRHMQSIQASIIWHMNENDYGTALQKYANRMDTLKLESLEARC